MARYTWAEQAGAGVAEAIAWATAVLTSFIVISYSRHPFRFLLR